MTEVNETIVLTSADIFCPQEPKDAYFVESGEILVYVVPWTKGAPGRRIHLCTVEARKMIPAFVYRDQDYKNWRFLLLAKDEAVLSVRKGAANSILKKKFIDRVPKITTYEQEGFEGSLAEFYKRELLADDVGIGRKGKMGEAAVADTYDTIKHAFKEDDAIDASDNSAYQAMQFLCGKMKVSLISQEDLVVRCGKGADVNTIARASHLICRSVVLEPGWYRSDCGALVGTLDGQTVACIPNKGGKYQIYYTSDGRVEKLTPAVAQCISPKAYSIGRTLPIKPLKKMDVFKFCQKSIALRDMVLLVALILAGALIGVLLPVLNQMIYDDYIPLGDMGSLAQMSVVILTFMIGNLLFAIVKNLVGFRITSRVGNKLQNALYHRLFHLPESFFRSYDSADLGQRVMTVGRLANSITNTLVITGLSALFSLIFLVQMCGYSGKLAWIGVGMYVLFSVVIAVISFMAKKREAIIAQADGEASSRLYQYLNGVDKIRMAGVEDRAMLSYMQPFAQRQREEIKVNRLVSAADTLSCVSSTIFSMVLYLIIVNSKLELSVGAFIGFTSAFGSFTGSLAGLVDELLKLYQEKDVASRVWPVFQAMPEDDDTKEVPGALSGGLSLEHVNFAYTQGGKNVLNDLTLKIKPKEYVGIVGSSGCGKSTLLKLLLGFETPQSGIVLVDDKDMKTLNKNAYRRQLGVVLQNGKLISGSIYENITITAPNTTMARVNEVIDQVGLRDDINGMPMGIHTMLSENCNTISGGQLQRILIARAIVGKPSILIFDEATSALDNLTQAAVSSNLDKMDVTRIVVAHRLSTIKNCDRILVLKDGSVAEEGNYESLMAKRGLFYALASRQIIE